MRKLTLVSVIANGTKRSAFVMLNAEKPSVTLPEIEIILGKKLPRGSTITIG